MSPWKLLLIAIGCVAFAIVEDAAEAPDAANVFGFLALAFWVAFMGAGFAAERRKQS